MNRFKYLMLIPLLHASNTLVAMEALKNKQDAIAKAQETMPTGTLALSIYPENIQGLINNLVTVRAERMIHIFFHPEALGRFEWLKEYDPKGAVAKDKTESYWAAQIETAIANYNKEKNASLKTPSDQEVADLAKQKISNDIVTRSLAAQSDKSTLEEVVRNTQSIIENIETAHTKKQKNQDAALFAESYYQTAKPAYEKALQEYKNKLAIEDQNIAQKKKAGAELMAKGYPEDIKNLIDGLVSWRVKMMELVFKYPQDTINWNTMELGRSGELSGLPVHFRGLQNASERNTEIKDAIKKYNKEHSTTFEFPSDDELNKLAKPLILSKNKDTLSQIEAYKEKNRFITTPSDTEKSKFARFYYETLKEELEKHQ